MNRYTVKTLISQMTDEIQNNEAVIQSLQSKNALLNTTQIGLTEWLGVKKSRVPQHVDITFDDAGISDVSEYVAPKRKLTESGRLRIAAAQRARWRTGKKGMKKKKAAKSMHWTQRPENKEKVRKQLRKMRKARKF